MKRDAAVVYSVGTAVPGGGIGNHAGMTLTILREKGLLKKAFAIEFADALLPNKLAREVPFALTVYRFYKFFNARANLSIIKDRWFDYLVARKLPACDIFHTWNNYALTSIAAAHKKGAKTIVERNSIHIDRQDEVLAKVYAEGGVPYERIPKILKERCRAEYEATDYIVCSSQLIKQSLVENDIPEHKIRVITLPVNIEKFPFKEKERRDAFTLLYAGRISPHKGIHWLLKAWKELRLPNAELLLNGTVQKGFEPFVAANTDDSVRIYYHPIPPEEFQRADAFVLPSAEDGFGLVTLEAMATGTPVIASDATGSSELLGDGGFRFESGDVETLKALIVKLYEDRELARATGRKGRTIAEAHTSVNYAAGLMNFYEEILA